MPGAGATRTTWADVVHGTRFSRPTLWTLTVMFNERGTSQ